MILIQSFGYLHGPIPEGQVIDLRRFLYNPANDSRLKYMTGEEQEVIRHVKNTSGYQEIAIAVFDLAWSLYTRVPRKDTDPIVLNIGCSGGRHRSVVISDDLFVELNDFGIPARVSHRDIDKPVIERKTI